MDRRRLAAPDRGRHGGARATPRRGRETTDGSPERVRDDFDGPASTGGSSTLRRPARRIGPTCALGPAALRCVEATCSRRGSTCLSSPRQLQDFTAVAETRVVLRPRHFSHSAGLVVLYDERNFAYLRLLPQREPRRATRSGILVVEDRRQAGVAARPSRRGYGSGGRCTARIEHGALRFCLGHLARGRAADRARARRRPTCPTRRRADSRARWSGSRASTPYRKDLLAHFDWFELRQRHDRRSVPPVRAVEGLPSSGGAARQQRLQTRPRVDVED